LEFILVKLKKSLTERIKSFLFLIQELLGLIFQKTRVFDLKSGLSRSRIKRKVLCQIKLA